ncbi:MAG: hypothetical protein RIC80_05840 [Cyclobacteriaceae bacterium]
MVATYPYSIIPKNNMANTGAVSNWSDVLDHEHTRNAGANFGGV